MYLHIGEDFSVRDKDIVGIFSLEEENVGDNSAFLRFSKEDGFIVKVNDDKPRSFILCHIEGKPVIYLSPISTRTLIKRGQLNSFHGRR